MILAVQYKQTGEVWE